MSAKLKNQGGTVTLDDILEELEKQGVDFEQEGNTIIVNGTHIYDFEEDSNEEIIWENQGTTAMPKPKIVAIEILERTDTTIKVKVTTRRNAGGTLLYSIKEEEGEYQEITRTTQATTGDPIEEEYTFTNLDADKSYTEIKVEAIAENGLTASKEIDIVKIPALTNKDVIFAYTVNGKSIKEGEYTQGPVTVKASIKNVDTTGYKVQYSQVDPKVGAIWEEYDTNGVEFTTKGNLYVRLSDGKQGGRYATAKVNIDTLPPKQFTPEVTTGIDYITVTGSTVDEEETTTSASSGIAKYQFSKDGGATWVPADGTTNTSYTFDNLKSGTNCKIQMKAIDKVGKEIITEPIEQATEEIEIAYQYSPSTWTNGNVEPVVVTIATTPSLPEGYTVEYSKDRSTWDSNANTMSQKGELYVRIKNANSYVIKDNMTANVVKIDNDKPKEFTITQESVTTSSITVKVTAEDAEATSTSAKSGIAGYRFSKDDGANWTDYQESGTYKFDNLIGNVAGVTYPIKVEAKDHAGNSREAKKDCTTTINSAYYCNTSGKLLCNIGGREFWKDNDKPAVVGMALQRDGGAYWQNPIVVSTDADAVKVKTSYDNLASPAAGSFDYHGIKFYYSTTGRSMRGILASNYPFLNIYDINFGQWFATAGKDLLDRYFSEERQAFKYLVNYDANGGVQEEKPQQVKTEGVALTLKSTKPTREGYTFKGWGTTSNATSPAYQPGSSYTTDANIYLFALWEAVPTEVELKDASATVKQAHNFYGVVTQSTPAYGQTNLILSNVPNLAVGQIVYVSNTAEYRPYVINAGYYKITGKNTYPNAWTYESLGTSYKVQQ